MQTIIVFLGPATAGVYAKTSQEMLFSAAELRALADKEWRGPGDALLLVDEKLFISERRFATLGTLFDALNERLRGRGLRVAWMERIGDPFNSHDSYFEYPLKRLCYSQAWRPLVSHMATRDRHGQLMVQGKLLTYEAGLIPPRKRNPKLDAVRGVFGHQRALRPVYAVLEPLGEIFDDASGRPGAEQISAGRPGAEQISVPEGAASSTRGEISARHRQHQVAVTTSVAAAQTAYRAGCACVLS